MAQTNPVNDDVQNGFRFAFEDETAFTASGAGLFDVQFKQLKEVHFAQASLAAGYFTAVYSISGNTVRFYIYKTKGAAGAFTLVGAAGDLGAAKAMAIGR